MDFLRDYMLNLIVGAMACSILLNLFPGKPFSDIGKFLCGVFLTISLLQPLSEADFSRFLSPETQPDTQSGEALAAMGQAYSQNLLAQCIKQDAQTYILDKAASLGLSLDAEVILSQGDIPVPESVTLTGSADDAPRSRLEQIIVQDLGIPKENQLWIQERSGNG